MMVSLHHIINMSTYITLFSSNVHFLPMGIIKSQYYGHRHNPNCNPRCVQSTLWSAMESGRWWMWLIKCRNSIKIYVSVNEIYEAIPQILRCTMAQPISCLALARFSYAKVIARHWVIGPEISFRSWLKYVGTHIFHLNLCYVQLLNELCIKLLNDYGFVCRDFTH